MMKMFKENDFNDKLMIQMEFLKFHTSVQTGQEGEMCCNYSLLLKEFGTIMKNSYVYANWSR